MDNLAIVSLSGGTDSTVIMAMAAERFDKIVAVSAFYGQKHEKELESAAEVAKFYGAEHVVLQLPNIFGGAGSTLIDPGLEQPQLSYLEILETVGPSPTVVPFRNANLISAATTIAVVKEASHVLVGMHATDANNWAYPDCTPEFLGAMANAIYVGTYQEVRLEFPLIWMHKIHVIRRGIELNAPFELTWSCYEGGDDQCGTCPTCVERIESFRFNRYADPVPYAIPIDWGNHLAYSSTGSRNLF